MNEKLISLNNIDVVKLFGSNNSKFNRIKTLFPQLQLISRGNQLKIQGNQDKINDFELKFQVFCAHLEKFNSLTVSQIERIVDGGEDVMEFQDDVILHGKSGKLIKAKSLNQRKMLASIDENDILFAVGPAGTGKTYTSVALAVKYLKERRVKRIILIRPAIEAGENLGFLPGDLKEKLDPYMQPIYDALFDMLPIDKLNEYLEDGTIQISPLAFMRGRTLDKAFVILDEGQNTTEHQMKMFLTRMGKSAKFIITGDITQIDLPKRTISGLISCSKILNKINGIKFIHLDERDVVRHKIVKQIIKAYKNINHE
ncbi:PhoH family protein [Flavobacteriales bacterium]|jgi:phosphate starvation-inducible protein PhoH and related proteins|nr:PhoH family protein [Flavobacteriales bacterium]